MKRCKLKNIKEAYKQGAPNMHATIKLKGVEFRNDAMQYSDGKPVFPDVDGFVRIAFERIYTEEEMKTHPNTSNPWGYDLLIPFKKGPHGKTEAGYFWGWDGNKEAPTLSPSFLADDLLGRGQGAGYVRIHLFFQQGKINLLSDSTVTLVN